MKILYRLLLITSLTIVALVATNHFTNNGIYAFYRNHFPISHTVPDDKKIVIATIEGGTGNQLFMYAAAYSLAKRLGAELWIKHQDNVIATTTNSAHRPYALSHFSIKFDYEIGKRDKVISKTAPVLVKEDNFFNITADQGQVFILKAYFESHIFFEDCKEDIASLFKLKNDSSSKLAKNKHYDMMKNTQSVAVHIRRGDFFKTPEKVVPFTYQILAMHFLKMQHKDAKFFVFSDDPSFAKSSFINLQDVVVVSEPDGDAIEEFELMRNCKHMITTNSTFSWWAAWLMDNPNKIIITPHPRYMAEFTADYNDFMKDLYNNKATPQDWIKINPFHLTL